MQGFADAALEVRYCAWHDLQLWPSDQAGGVLGLWLLISLNYLHPDLADGLRGCSVVLALWLLAVPFLLAVLPGMTLRRLRAGWCLTNRLAATVVLPLLLHGSGAEGAEDGYGRQVLLPLAASIGAPQRLNGGPLSQSQAADRRCLACKLEKSANEAPSVCCSHAHIAAVAACQSIC